MKWVAVYYIGLVVLACGSYHWLTSAKADRNKKAAVTYVQQDLDPYKLKYASEYYIDTKKVYIPFNINHGDGTKFTWYYLDFLSSVYAHTPLVGSDPLEHAQNFMSLYDPDRRVYVHKWPNKSIPVDGELVIYISEKHPMYKDGVRSLLGVKVNDTTHRLIRWDWWDWDRTNALDPFFVPEVK